MMTGTGVPGRTLRGVVLILMVLVIATEPAAAQAPVVRDSAGVRIVENQAPTWGPGEAWRVEAEPMLSIGEEDGDDPHLLLNVRAASVLSDGTVVLALGWWGHGSRYFQLRYYDAEGRYLASAGRYGQGPGELERPYGIHRMAGDSILAHDRSRFAVFGPRGELGRTGRFGPMGFVADTRLVSGSTLVGLEEAPQERTNSGRVITSFRSAILADLETDRLDTMGVLVAWGVSHSQGLILPFTPESLGTGLSLIAGGQGLAWIANSQDAEARGYAADGALEVIARNSSPPRPLGPDLVRRWREGPYERWLKVQEDWGLDMRAYRAFPQERDMPATVPAYSALTTDAIGNVWMQVYPLLGEEGTPARDFWDIYDPTGIWMGTIEFPLEVTGCETKLDVRIIPCDSVLEIGDAYVLILHRDAQRIARVRVHRLVKP